MSRAGKQAGSALSQILTAYRRRPPWQRWLVVVVWMGLIFAVSAQPSLPEAPDPWFDVLLKKLAHMLEYAILCLLFWGALPADVPWWAWVLAVLYAASDEIHQTFVPGRNGWIVDVLVDGVVVDIGSVGAAEVVQHQLSTDHRDASVLPRHRIPIEHDVVLGIPPDSDQRSVEQVPPAHIGPRRMDQHQALTPSAGQTWLVRSQGHAGFHLDAIVHVRSGSWSEGAFPSKFIRTLV